MQKRYVVLLIMIVLLIVKILFAVGIFELNKKYDLTGRFGLTGNVVGYGVYEVDSSEDFISNMNKIYAEEKEKGKKVYFVFGDENEVKVVNYEEIVLGKVGIISGKVTSNLDINEDKYVSQSIKPKDNSVDFVVDGEKYKFKLKKGEKIYFIISEDEN